METTNLPLKLNQVVDLVKQLPYDEKLKLSEVLKEYTMQKPENNNIVTHFASENVFAKDWLLPEEDEAWKDLYCNRSEGNPETSGAWLKMTASCSEED